MTQKARALGMGHTTYVNASGLPDDDQVTTAHDQASLGRAIQDRFPRYYRFFSTTSFVFHGVTIYGHNHLLGWSTASMASRPDISEPRASMITSVHRDGRYIVGSCSADARHSSVTRTWSLIEGNMKLASTQRPDR